MELVSISSGRAIRCEITIPKKYNDGRDVEPALHKLTWDELVNRFGGATGNEGTGAWMHLGKVYEEGNYIYKVDVVDSSDILFLRHEYKEVLKQRFDQKEIYIMMYPIWRA